MKFLFITNRTAFSTKSFGGAESSIKLLSEKLAERSHEIHYLTLQKPKFIEVSLIKNSINLHFTKYIIGSSKLKLICFLNQLILSKKINRLIKKYDIQLIYCFYELNILQAIKALKQKNSSVITVMRMAGLGWYEISKKSSFALNQYESTFNIVDSINFIHPELEKMTREKMEKIKMNVRIKSKFNLDIGTSLNINKNSPFPKVFDNRNTFRMIMAARFTDYQKRQDIIIRAAALLDPKIDYEILLIGSGSEERKAKELINHHSLSDKVKIIPFLNQEELWNLMHNSDLLLHASDYEGLGKIIIESMAIGLPVLVSNVTPLNFYIKDSINGFLVENKDIEWAKKIHYLIKEVNKRLLVSKNSIDFINEYFNPDINVIMYEEEFSKLINR